MVAALLLVIAVKPFLPAGADDALVGFALFITSIVFAVASIANNNLQDLKTGQLVDATPSLQQWALVIGVLVGALVIPPVMDLLQHTYGFLGAPGADPSRALPAPQAGLISALAKGVITGDVPWDMIGLGAGIGVAIILLDEILGLAKKTARLPPLAVGLGIYLPTSTTLMVVVGALVGAWFDRRAGRRPAAQADATRQLGVLLASGLIVGESLLAVIFAAIVEFSGEDSPIGIVGESFKTPAIIIGGVVFVATIFVLYRWIEKLGRKAV